MRCGRYTAARSERTWPSRGELAARHRNLGRSAGVLGERDDLDGRRYRL